MNVQINAPLLKKKCFALLFLSFFLPMAESCSTSKLFAKKESYKPEVSAPRENLRTHYAWEVIVSDNASAKEIVFLAVIPFLWPLPFLLTRRPGKRYQMYLKSGGELCTAIIGTYLYTIHLMFHGRLLIGAYVYLLAAGVYFFLILYELGMIVRKQFGRRTPS